VSATVIPFPRRPRREPQIEIVRDREGGGWLVVNLRGHGDLHHSLDAALADAKQIAFDCCIRTVHLAETIIEIEGGAP